MAHTTTPGSSHSPKWTTQCAGDIGLEILRGRGAGEHSQVIVMAFFHPHGDVPTHLSVYDVVAGGEPTILPLAKGLTFMEALANAHALKLVSPHQSSYYTRLDPGTQREHMLGDEDWPQNGRGD